VGATLLFKGPKGRFRYERGTKKAIGALGCAVHAVVLPVLCCAAFATSKKASGALCELLGSVLWSFGVARETNAYSKLRVLGLPPPQQQQLVLAPNPQA